MTFTRSRPQRSGGKAVLAAGLTTVTVLAAGCGSSSPGSSAAVTNPPGVKLSGTVIVFAAASLNSAFDKLGSQFEKLHPGTSLKFNYAGSSSLATQLTQGAKADLFASANPANMKIVQDASLTAGTPTDFAQNKLEIVVGKGNPLHITSVKDLSKSGIKVAVCQQDVPCGAYSADVFKKAGVTVKPVSEETSVSGVLTKVSLGEADAGIVYVTDVKAAGDKVTGVQIPPNQNVIADYPIDGIKGAPNANTARAFENYLLSPAGQKVLDSYGFLPPAG